MLLDASECRRKIALVGARFQVLGNSRESRAAKSRLAIRRLNEVRSARRRLLRFSRSSVLWADMRRANSGTPRRFRETLVRACPLVFIRSKWLSAYPNARGKR